MTFEKKKVIELSTSSGSTCVKAIFISLRTIDATKENVDYTIICIRQRCFDKTLFRDHEIVNSQMLFKSLTQTKLIYS